MSARLTKVSGKLHGRFLLRLGILLGVLAVTWYACFAMNGVFYRSTESVANTEWISWENGSIQFAESTARFSTDEAVLTYDYEERDGTIWMKGETDADQMILVRFKSARLITSDGKMIFYQKQALPEGSSVDE